jgi:hypothetical protein
MQGCLFCHPAAAEEVEEKLDTVAVQTLLFGKSG